MHIHEPHHLPAEVPDPAAQDEVTVIPLKIEDWLTVIVMGLLALITFANVLVRYFTSQSFAWTEEFSVFLMIVLALVAGSASVARNRQIRIEFFADSGSAARQRALAPLWRADDVPAVCADRRAQHAGRVRRHPLRRDLAGHRRAAVVVHHLAAGDVGGHLGPGAGPVHPPRPAGVRAPA
jgi:hypothetical protein